MKIKSANARPPNSTINSTNNKETFVSKSSHQLSIMSALDQSLDDILSSKPKKQFRKRTPVAKAKVGKTVGKPKVNLRKQLQTKGAAPKGSVLDASYANKVVVYHLPKDIKQDAIKVCFEYCCV